MWCAEGIETATARVQFLRIIEQQRETYSTAWGITVSAGIQQHGNIFIGHLYCNPGVIGWDSWIQDANGGLVWNGVCENYLGREWDDREIRSTLDTLASSPSEVCCWDGSFYVISWDKAADKVCLTTGATECPTLWYTRGPYGWAAGSRAAPILDMVGHAKRVSAAACNVYLAYGYNYSNASLFEHVQRVPQRSQVVIVPGAEPRLSRYATLAEYVQPGGRTRSREETLAGCADRLVTRISRQLNYSTNPEILITGGRDSRCIAAAAKRAGYKGVISTGGAADCRDVVIGQKVAQRLGLSHRHTPDRVSMVRFGKTIDRLRLWSDMSEGVEVLRHVRAYNQFVDSKPANSERLQLFHGLGGEIGRGYYYHNATELEIFNTSDYSIGRKILLAAADQSVPLGAEGRALLEARWDDFSTDIGTDQATVAQWLDMFFWQNSCLRWGGDMLSVKNPMYWTWTPLLDKELIRAYWDLDLEDKRSDRFIQDLALTLAGELKGLGYESDVDQHSSKKPLGGRILANLMRGVKRGLACGRPSAAGSEAADMIRFWEAVLLDDMHRAVWVDCIDERDIRKLIYSNPQSEVLWNTATVQLVADGLVD